MNTPYKDEQKRKQVNREQRRKERTELKTLRAKVKELEGGSTNAKQE